MRPYIVKFNSVLNAEINALRARKKKRNYISWGLVIGAACGTVISLYSEQPLFIGVGAGLGLVAGFLAASYFVRARNMRGYVLTETEKETIKEYLSTGKKLDGFGILKMRAFRLSLQTLKSDIELVEAFKEKLKAGES